MVLSNAYACGRPRTSGQADGVDCSSHEAGDWTAAIQVCANGRKLPDHASGIGGGFRGRAAARRRTFAYHRAFVEAAKNDVNAIQAARLAGLGAVAAPREGSIGARHYYVGESSGR